MYPPRLPYIDNAKAVLITLAINLAAALAFDWPEGVDYYGVMLDGLFCAVITTAIDMVIVYSEMKKLRARGALPRRVPESRFMQRLPRHPLALGGLYAVVFAALTVGGNAAVLGFFGIRALAFLPWAVYKLIYATVLSCLVVEYCIFRYVQPDWAGEGMEGIGQTTGGEKAGQTVKNPLPKIGVCSAIYGAVTGNLAMNLILGSLLGGVRFAADASVVILPTTVEGIPITGLVFGLIVGILVTRGVTAALSRLIRQTGPALLSGAAADRRYTWLPKGTYPLTALVCVCVMAFSAVVLPLIMRLFAIPVMNFYQFTLCITIYAALLGKPLSYLLTQRCMQPDYIKHVLGKGTVQD